MLREELQNSKTGILSNQEDQIPSNHELAQHESLKNSLKELVSGHRTKERVFFQGYPGSVTVYLSVNDRYSKFPHINATMMAAMHFQQVRFIIPSTLDFDNRKNLPENINKSKETLLQELKEDCNKWLKEIEEYFAPFKEQYGDDWEQEDKVDWEVYTNSNEFAFALDDLNKVYQFLQTHEANIIDAESNSNNASNYKLNNQKSIDKRSVFSYTLKTAIDATVLKRLNDNDKRKNGYQKKAKTLDLFTKQEIEDVGSYVFVELAQLLVRALELKQKPLNPQYGDAILYAKKLNEAMYKLLDMLKCPKQHEIFSEIDNILDKYKIPDNLMQPLSINDESLQVKQIKEKSKNEVIKMLGTIQSTNSNFKDGTIGADSMTQLILQAFAHKCADNKDGETLVKTIELLQKRKISPPNSINSSPPISIVPRLSIFKSEKPSSGLSSTSSSPGSGPSNELPSTLLHFQQK